MTYTTPTITVTPAGGSTYTMPNVQTAGMNAGRRYLSDNWMPRTFRFEFIPTPTSYTPKVSDVVKVSDGASGVYFYGFVTDSSRTYDMPYNVSTGATPGDRVVVEAQSLMGQMGQTSASWTTGAANYTCVGVAGKIATAADVSISQHPLASANNPYVNDGVEVSDDGYMLDSFNKLGRTANWVLIDGGNWSGATPTVYFGTPIVDQIYFTLTDTGSGFAYEGLQFESNARNQYNKVIVDQYSGNDQIVTNAGITYENSWTVTTYFANKADSALDLANYYLSTLSLVSPPPMSARLTSLPAQNADLHKLLWQWNGNSVTYGWERYPSLGFAASIALRGSTYNAVIQGLSATWYPDRLVVDLFFMPSLGAPFTLDSVTNGVLDQNVLGLAVI